MALKVISRKGWLVVVGRYRNKRVDKSTRLRAERKANWAEAEKIMRRIEGEIRAGGTVGAHDDAPTTFKHAVNSYLAAKEREGKNALSMKRQLKTALEYMGDHPLDEIDERVIEDYIDWAAGDWAPGSIRRRLVQLKAVLRHAAKRGWLVMPEIEMPSVDDARDEHFSLDEINRFLEWVRENRRWAWPWFMFLIDTGARLGESMRVTWRDVRREEVVLNKKPNSKTTSARIVPLSPRLDIALRILKTDSGASSRDYVFKLPGGNAGDEYASAASAVLGKILRRGCLAIGVNPPLRVHDLRHTFAYQAAIHGADLGDLQKLMGHASLDMTLRYRGFIPSRATKVIKNFGSVVDEGGPHPSP